MKRILKRLALLSFVLVVAGCAKDSEFQRLKAQVNVWAHGGTYDTVTYEGVVNWQRKTYQVICDIYNKNTPDRNSATSTSSTATPAYDPMTVTYCGGTDGNGNPDDPPPFGD